MSQDSTLLIHKLCNEAESEVVSIPYLNHSRLGVGNSFISRLNRFIVNLSLFHLTSVTSNAKIKYALLHRKFECIALFTTIKIPNA